MTETGGTETGGTGAGDAALIWSPFGDEDSAATVATALLDEGLIACANILPGIRSLYIWQGERGEGREVAVMFKTRVDRLEAAMARLEALHPYEAPAICGWRCDATGNAARNWLETMGPGTSAPGTVGAG